MPHLLIYAYLKLLTDQYIWNITSSSSQSESDVQLPDEQPHLERKKMKVKFVILHKILESETSKQIYMNMKFDKWRNHLIPSIAFIAIKTEFLIRSSKNSLTPF